MAFFARKGGGLLEKMSNSKLGKLQSDPAVLIIRNEVPQQIRRPSECQQK